MKSVLVWALMAALWVAVWVGVLIFWEPGDVSDPQEAVLEVRSAEECVEEALVYLPAVYGVPLYGAPTLVRKARALATYCEEDVRLHPYSGPTMPSGVYRLLIRENEYQIGQLRRRISRLESAQGYYDGY